MSVKQAYKFFPYLENSFPYKFESDLLGIEICPKAMRDSVLNLFSEIWKHRHRDLKEPKVQERINRKAFKNNRSTNPPSQI